MLIENVSVTYKIFPSVKHILWIIYLWIGPLGMGRAKFEGNEKLSCQWAWEEIERTGWWHICTQFNRSYMWEIYLYISPSLSLSLFLSLFILDRRTHTISFAHIQNNFVSPFISTFLVMLLLFIEPKHAW